MCSSVSDSKKQPNFLQNHYIRHNDCAITRFSTQGIDLFASSGKGEILQAKLNDKNYITITKNFESTYIHTYSITIRNKKVSVVNYAFLVFINQDALNV